MAAHEVTTGHSYSWILRTRFDIAYLADMPLPPQLSPQSAYMPYGLVPCMNDHVFICPRALCRPYFTMTELWESRHCKFPARGDAGNIFASKSKIPLAHSWMSVEFSIVHRRLRKLPGMSKDLKCLSSPPLTIQRDFPMHTHPQWRRTVPACLQ